MQSLVTPHGAALDGRADEHEPALRARDGALDEQQPALGVDLVHVEREGGGLHRAHAAGHAQALEHAAGGGRATDGARRPVLALGAVRGAQAAEAVPLHDTGGALALAGADDVDLRDALEHLGGQLLADLVRRGVLRAQLDQVPARRHTRLGEVPTLGLVHLAGVDLAEAELDGRVAVHLGGAHLGDHARARLDDGHRHDAVVLVEDLGHAQLLAEKAAECARHVCFKPLLDVDVDRRRQVDAHERVHRLGGRVEDVDEALVRAHLEVLARVLVLVRRADDAVHVLLRRQRHRADHARTGLGHRVDDAPRGGVDRLVVVGLQPDADLLSRHRCSSLLPIGMSLALGWVRTDPGDGRRPDRPPPVCGVLLDDLRDATGADGAATLTDGEPQALLHGDRLDQLDRHLGVVARHDHLGAGGQRHDARHIRRPEVELRTVVVEERRVPATLVLREDVDRALEVRVRGDGTRLHDDLAALDVLALDAAEQEADVVTGLALVEQLAEHLDAGDGGLGRGRADADDLDLLRHLDDAALHATGHDGAAAGDGEDVLDGHEERLVDLALRLGDRGVDRVHELHQLVAPLLVALEGLQSGDANHGDVVARELVLGQQLADLQLDELEDLLVVDHVGLVQRHDDVGDADLAGQEDMLLGLRHRAVGRRDHEDGAVHLRRAGDHVLDVVGVTGAVDVRVVPVLGLVLDVGDRDRDAASLLLGRLVDLVEGRRLVEVRVLVVQHLGDRRGQRRLPVVDVPDGADVDVRLGPLELGLGHWVPLSVSRSRACLGLGSARESAGPVGARRLGYSPGALAVISLATLAGTSAYESNTMV